MSLREKNFTDSKKCRIRKRRSRKQKKRRRLKGKLLVWTRRMKVVTSLMKIMMRILLCEEDRLILKSKMIIVFYP